MKYKIKTSDLIIGSTNLENVDSSMGIAHGIFLPEKDYGKVQDVFQLFISEHFEEYYKSRDNLNLELIDEDGNTILTDCIHIEDYLAKFDEATIEIKFSESIK
ncbi:hypothetical protein [Shewanella sp. Isolate11]|uniref:hypothetical protein n=1 Tax=Shewanella sp. Isolate11 TaxID=2908530 RepID=UPI001EFDBA14|nr:hypothetical protein [Shewanella sp. Isolate11]MCG9697059.1 hypothetical protein [Shewanella sp. Isolate11]